MRVDGTDRPRVKRLEWLADKGMVLVELESKPEMPTVILLPREQVSAIIPLKSKPKEATKAKLPDETVSSSKSEPLAEWKEGSKENKRRVENLKKDFDKPKKKRKYTKKKKD